MRCLWLFVLAGLAPACGGTGGYPAVNVTSQTCGALTDTWSNYASGFFQNNCGSCHSFARSYASVNADSSQIEAAIADGRMPPSGMSTPAEQRIVTWLECGSPQ